jgi:glycosyltransferase involved in cell wall biosynthesis
VRDADIVHLHTLWHPLNTIARRACAQYRRKYVLSPHGMLDPYSLGVKSLRKRLYLNLREKTNLRHASRIIFTTPLEEELAKKSLPWLGEGAIIPLGADMPPPARQEEMAMKFLACFPAAKDKRRFIFLGRLHPKKGLERILEVLPDVVEACPSVLLIIVGSGEPPYVQELGAKTEKLGLREHVLFTGMLQGELKWGALAASELFLLPSHQENFAIAAAEAMHSGLPIILSDKVNLWPFVQEAGAGIVLENKTLGKSLAQTILQLLADAGVSRAMGRRGQLFARENFAWTNTARLTFQLYEKVLSEQQQVITRGHATDSK